MSKEASVWPSSRAGLWWGRCGRNISVRGNPFQTGSRADSCSNYPYFRLGSFCRNLTAQRIEGDGLDR